MEEGEGSGGTMTLAFWILMLLPPSLRERRRYLVFEVMSERELSKKELLREIREAMFSLYGDVGVSESGIRLIGYQNEKGTNRGVGIVRCAHTKVEGVRAAVASIHSVNGARLGIRVIGISGTIKGATRLYR
jgi:ribonuclease P/MRP protein subunit POP5